MLHRDQAKMLAVVCGLVAAFIIGFWMPRKARENHLWRAVEQSQQLVEQSDMGGSGLIRLAGQVVQLQNAAAQAEKYVPEGDHLADLLRSLSTSLAEIEAQSVITETQPPVIGPQYGVIPVKQRFRASFTQVHDYLQRVEAIQRLVQINHVQVRRPMRESDPLLEISIDLSAFFIPETGGGP